MIYKPFFILYLILSSSIFSLCSNIEDTLTEEENKYVKKVINLIKTKGLDYAKDHITELGTTIAVSKYPHEIEKIVVAVFEGVNNLLTTIGNGIVRSFSAIYNSLVAAFGVKVAGYFVAGGLIIVVVGSALIVYKIISNQNQSCTDQYQYRNVYNTTIY